MGILSGMNRAQRQAFAADSERMAKEQDEAAREYSATAAANRKKYGVSSPDAEMNARICEANARDLRKSAATVREWRS